MTEAEHLITPLADNQLPDGKEKDEILHLISTDPSVRYDYEVQKLIKELVSRSCPVYPVPLPLKIKIINRIKLLAKRKKSRKRHLISAASAAVLIISLLILYINRTPPGIETDFAASQQGSGNMYIQAVDNFNAVLAGTLQPGLITDSPEAIKNYFNAEGVKYSTAVPVFDDWQILGAVVSSAEGEKFAHHLYSADKGELVYIFQVKESYIYEKNIVSLHPELVKYLDDGHCYIKASGGITTLMTKSGDNIMAVVSNLGPSVIEDRFCKIN